MKRKKPVIALVECPFCKKRMKGRILAEHVKSFHAKDPKSSLPKGNLKEPLLDGIEVKSPDLIRDMQRRVIDEQGFLVSPDLIPETKINSDTGSPLHQSVLVRNDQPPRIFEGIKTLASTIPGAKTKKYRPHASQEVFCPICHQGRAYKDLFDHITITHKELNAKIVMANFNREYEIEAKANPIKHRYDEDPPW